MPQKWDVKRTCEICHKIFYARKHDVSCGRGIYCSWKCSGKSKKTSVKRICEFCGSSFEVQHNRIKKGFGKFCSMEHFLSSYRNKIKKCIDCDAIIDNRATRCVKCSRKAFIPHMLGKHHTLEFRRRLSELKKNKKSPKTSKDKHWNWSGGKPKCVVCNKVLAGYNGIRCKPCQGKNITGKKHYNWKGGKSCKREKIMNSRPYRLWRKSVFQRDKYTCQKCGLVGNHLNAHHKKSFTFYPKLRFKIDNGITLCKICHSRMHKGIPRRKKNAKN